jgi:lipopolysaccharide export LptBFGC system permease protein LptF
VTLILYLLRLLSAAVVVSAGGLFFIAIPGAVVGAVQRLGGSNMMALLGFMPLVLVDLVPYLLPIGFLLAVVATYGRLAADNEWTAINMAGIHPLRMMLPGLIIACVLGGVSHWLTNEVSPGLGFAKREYARKILIESFRDVNPGRTEVAFRDFYLSAQSRDPESKVFRDVTIHVPSKARRSGATTIADEAGWTVIADIAEFTFHDSLMRIDLTRARSADNEGHAVRLGHSAVEVDIDELLQLKPSSSRAWRFKDSTELARMIDDGEVPEAELRGAVFALHDRRAMTATYVLFLLLGVPTGLLLRRGTQLGALAAAVGYALLYYLLEMRLGKTMASWGMMPPGLAAWATSILGGIAGVWLCWRAFRR